MNPSRLDMRSAPRSLVLASLIALDATGAGVEPPAVRELHGRILVPDGGSPVGLRARLRAGAERDSAEVGADGIFVLRLAGVRCDSVDVEIAAISDSGPTYHPVAVRVGVSRRAAAQRLAREGVGPEPLLWEPDPPPPDSVRIVVVPTAFTIESGSYSGRTIPIAIDAAMASGGQAGRFWRVSESSPMPGAPVAWPETSLPLHLMVDVAAGAISSPDTAAFWSAARQLERDFGRSLFRPATRESLAADEWHVALRLAPTSADAGVTFVSWGSSGTLFGASIELRSAALLRDERVVTHELLHALGVGHSRWRPSVMHGSAEMVTRATPDDIAYAQLLYRIRRAHIGGRATHGPAAAARWRPAGGGGPSGCGAGALAMFPSP